MIVNEPNGTYGDHLLYYMAIILVVVLFAFLS